MNKGNRKNLQLIESIYLLLFINFFVSLISSPGMRKALGLKFLNSLNKSCEGNADSESNSNRKYLIIKPRGGLGNRLGSIASAYAVAELSNRTLVLDWASYINGTGIDLMEMPVHFNELFVNSFCHLIHDPFSNAPYAISSPSGSKTILSKDTQKRLLSSSDLPRQKNVYNIELATSDFVDVILRESNLKIVNIRIAVRDFIGPILDSSSIGTGFRIRAFDAHTKEILCGSFHLPSSNLKRV